MTTGFQQQLNIFHLYILRRAASSVETQLVLSVCAQGINVLISVKCFAHMFPNTHSWYHSMSARPEEAVSYRCQYPR